MQKPTAPAPDPTGRDSRLFITSLERGLQVLTAFSEGRSSMKLAELAQAADISKSSAQRFAHTLVTLGYLRKDDASKAFSLAPRALETGLRYLQTSALVKGANPYLHSLNRACKETCSLAEPDGLDMVYVSRFPAHKEMFVNMPVGMRIPMYCTASGRAILSRLETDVALDILRRSTRVAYTASTITDLGRLKDLLIEARAEGFAWADSEYYRGDVNIGAPILDASGTPIAAVNISAAASRFKLAQAKLELGPQAVETARAISSSTAVTQHA
jgi:IclR family transcriptional regulator, pca regulon regulatory protein